MALQDIWDWLALVSGGALAASGLAIGLFGLFRDRSRGRRRCPRCWYDLGHVHSLPATCTECGRRIRHQRGLHRTRRHLRAAAAGVLVLLLGVCLCAFPFGRDGRWVRWVPDTAVIALLPVVDDDWPITELTRRFNSVGQRDEYAGQTVNGFDRLWGWQWRLLAAQAGRLSASDAPLKRRQDALVILLQHCPDPSPAAVSLVRCLGDEQWRQRWLAAWGIKANRHAWSPAARAKLLPALEALRTDPNARTAEGAELALKAFALPGPADGAASAALDPESVERMLQGANSATVGLIFKRLRANPHSLMWAYDGEGGPYRVIVFDLEIDGRPGQDRVLLVGDRWSVHFAALVWLKRRDAWRFAGGLNLANNPGAEPVFFSVSAPGSPVWLVWRQLAGHTGDRSYELFADMYFSVRGGTIRPSGVVWSGGHTTRGTATAPATPVDWTLTSSHPRVVRADGKHVIELDVDAGFVGIRINTWPREMAERTDLFRTKQTVRLRPAADGWLVPDPATPWADREVVARSILDGADAFVAAQSTELFRIARDGTEGQRRWLRLFLTDCAAGPEQERLLQALDTSAGP